MRQNVVMIYISYNYVSNSEYTLITCMMCSKLSHCNNIYNSNKIKIRYSNLNSTEINLKVY